MLYNPTIYTASKIWHATRWQQLRDHEGFNVIATWIDTPCGTPENPTGAKILTADEKMELWYNCALECGEADMTVIYTEETDSHRGVLVELGGALTMGKPVFLIGDCPDFRPRGDSDAAYTNHPNFHRTLSHDWFIGYNEAVQMYRDIYRSTEHEIKPNRDKGHGYTFGRHHGRAA